MKKLLIFALFAASMQAMEKMDLHTSAELIRSLVEGDLEVAGNQISTPQGTPYTFDAFHEGLKDHGVIIDNGNMSIKPITDYAENLGLFFTNADIEHLAQLGEDLDELTVAAILKNREKLIEGLVMKNPSILRDGLKGPLHILDEDSLQ